MQEKIREIAARVREMREIMETEQEEMARHLNIPVETYRDYEEGNADIPASVLYEISQKFNVEMGVLLTGENPRMHIYTVTRSNHGVSVERRKQYRYQNLAANFIHKRIEPFLVTVDPKPAGSEIHRNSHPGQEFNFLIEGRMKIYIHNKEIVLEKGDSIYFDSGYDHAMEALDNAPATFLAIIL